jgi:hypothetical protein
MPTVDQVKMRVLKMLSSHMDVRMDDDGDILIRHESAVCWVSVNQWGKSTNEGHDIVVQVRAPIIWDVKRTPALYEWVATEGQGFVIGNAACTEDSDPSLTNVFLKHNLIGDNLDEPEIVHTVGLVLSTANQLDDELVVKFGGRKSIN